jgi:RNA-dependent RNA polymerase
MLGAKVEYGEDENNHRHPGIGLSYLSFDWTNENLLMKARMEIDAHKLPPALRPLDAELSFDDIASQGIMIDEKCLNPTAQTHAQMFSVTITISTRRPPWFFIPWEGLDYGQSTRLHRRRSTAMDFAISGVVRTVLVSTNDRVRGMQARFRQYQKAPALL